MNKYATVYAAAMNKVAAPIQPAVKPAQPAYVGNYSYDNKYLNQLANNYVKAGGDKSTADFFISMPNWQFGGRPSLRKGDPITQSTLERRRKVNAASNAKYLFDKNTKQHEAYTDWLIRRGAENQKFFQQNDLQHDPKSSIPLPPILQKEPADIQKKMHIESKGMAHNNSYNKFKNGIPS